MARKKLTDAAGLLVLALIAHGRGEAFDYLLQEQFVRRLDKHSCLCGIPVFGRASGDFCQWKYGCACGPECCSAALLGCPIEVNIYYRMKECLRYSQPWMCKIEAGDAYPDLKSKSKW